MNFDTLVKHIRTDGCRVRVLKKVQYVEGSAGTFGVNNNGPLINIATKKRTQKKRIITLLHEYGHYMQWREGFLPIIDEVCDTYDLHYRWTTGKIELTELEWQIARNTMLWIEYDAEKRGFDIGNRLGIKFNKSSYIKGADGYMISIKWSWLTRRGFIRAIQPPYVRKTTTFMSNCELFAPLTDKEKNLCRFILLD